MAGGIFFYLNWDIEIKYMLTNFTSSQIEITNLLWVGLGFVGFILGWFCCVEFSIKNLVLFWW